MTKALTLTDLGRMKYRDAWERQERAHERALAGGEEEIFLVEHEPVITFGRRGETPENLKASVGDLEKAGIEVVQSDRGGDVTYHGPGQIVAYPIVRLAEHGFRVGCYVHWLEKVVIAVLGEIGIDAWTDPKAVGVWVHQPPRLPSPGLPREGEHAAKICAIGVRIRRGISLHGLALNVSGDLAGFSQIVPCGLVGRGVTSVERVLGERAPSMQSIKRILGRRLIERLGG
jgi:lipoyl(octanoyl) transferase